MPDPPPDLCFPDHAQLLAQGVVLDAAESEEMLSHALPGQHVRRESTRR